MKIKTILKYVKPGEDFWYTKEYNKALVKLQDGMPEGFNAATKDFGSLVKLPADTIVQVENGEEVPF
jgi:hypothetical protein